MRILVLFDLPVESLENKRDYRKFHKFLVTSGFLMLQESVYCKLALNQTVAQAVMSSVRKERPSEGNVKMMIITEKQFARMECLVGDEKDSVVDTDEKLVVL